MKAIGYIRVSTEGQATEGVSLDAQKAKIAAWCTGNGFELADTFIDAGISGKTIGKRPGLQAAIAATCEMKAALVVYSLSRLARSTKDAIAISDQLNKAGADLVSLSERIDTTSAAGKMIFRMMAVMAEFERDLVSERTCAALQHMKSQGQRVGTIPYGFRVAEDGATLIANPDEQRVVAIVLQLRRDGVTLAGIRAELEQRGIENRAGKTAWSLSVLHKITKEAA
jgi:site-specific DNA recombinase